MTHETDGTCLGCGHPRDAHDNAGCAVGHIYTVRHGQSGNDGKPCDCRLRNPLREHTYSTEQRDSGWTVYRDRTPSFHGWNLGTMTEETDARAMVALLNVLTSPAS